MMPFNVAHLGQSAYGLWALTTSITFYFSVLDLGYGGALVKFIAQYRAWRDRQALNEILSTMFVVFTGVGVVTFVVTAGIAWQFGRLFRVTPDQVATGQALLLVTGALHRDPLRRQHLRRGGGWLPALLPQQRDQHLFVHIASRSSPTRAHRRRRSRDAGDMPPRRFACSRSGGSS